MIDTLIVGMVVGYLVLGAIITAWSWHRRDDSDADLIDLAVDLNASGPADRLAHALGTGLAILVGVLLWPLSVRALRTPAPPALVEPETPRILRQPPPDDTFG